MGEVALRSYQEGYQDQLTHIYRAQWIGIVERIVGEVALRSYQEGSRAQLTHIDRDKGGHKAQVLEASRNFCFSHFT